MMYKYARGSRKKEGVPRGNLPPLPNSSKKFAFALREKRKTVIVGYGNEKQC
jgi:hypothetical protein